LPNDMPPYYGRPLHNARKKIELHPGLLVNFSRVPMTQFSIRWKLCLNRLSQFRGQVQVAILVFSWLAPCLELSQDVLMRALDDSNESAED